MLSFLHQPVSDVAAATTDTQTVFPVTATSTAQRAASALSRQAPALAKPTTMAASVTCVPWDSTTSQNASVRKEPTN